MTKTNDYSLTKEGRLLSLDFFRGFTMFLLIAEGTHLFSHLVDPQLNSGFINTIGNQFFHHPWHGLRFWDLVQPFFMFIVGVALPFSVAKRKEKGDTFQQIFKHVLFRSLILLLLGWGLYCIGPGRITFRFQNVLAQIAVTYLIAFLIMRRSTAFQIIFAFGLLLLTELTYRFFPLDGYNEAFVPDKNFGAWFDMFISGELSGGHWVSINAIPTAAHTICGVLAGQLLISKRLPGQKLKLLLIAGFIAVLVGLALDTITPIIKRISTSSFVILTGGICLLVLCFSYWLIDVKKVSKWTKAFAVVGMNSLFIYMLTNTGGGEWIYGIFKPFTMALFSWTGESAAGIITSLFVWGGLWYICYWMYRRRVFVKI